MDGITDAAFRRLIAHTHPASVSFTEFVNVEGLARGAVSMLKAFQYSELERPIVAQIYGTEEDSFYKCALMVCALGFDGIDINMGCPAKKVERRGAGAGLIETPEHAQTIIRSVQKARDDWANGITLAEAGIRPRLITAIEKMCTSRREEHPPYKGDTGGNSDFLTPLPSLQGGLTEQSSFNPRLHSENRKRLPVSVKTRIGTCESCIETWIPNLLEMDIDALTVHGRTLKQMYTGSANWEVIARIAKIVKDSGKETLFLGNGDITDLEDGKNRCETAKTNGALIGRALFGNPWFFSGKIPESEERLKTAILHSQIYEECFPDAPFFPMRKHLGWYAKGFDGAKELRNAFMHTNSAEEVALKIQEIQF
ncbi:MAG: tRNA-dihydrouridine synthase [Candidatus Peregrinibacteria bacterium]